MHTSSSSPIIYHFFIYINLLTILLTVHSTVYGHTTLPSCSDLSVATAAQAQVVYCSPSHPSSQQQQQLTAKAVRSIAEFKSSPSSSSSPRRKSINNKLNKPSSSSSSSSEFIVDIQKNLPNLSFAAAISYLLYEYFRKVGGGGGGNESSSDKVTQ
jgi:hypothetical protein